MENLKGRLRTRKRKRKRKTEREEGLKKRKSTVENNRDKEE